MDRDMCYIGAIWRAVNSLSTNRNAMIAFGAMIQAVLGTATLVDGLACTPTSPASMQVSIGAGSITSLQAVDSTAYSALPADTADQIMKMGIQLQPQLLTLTAPSTTGYSTNYLVQVSFAETDGNPLILPYYNQSNPLVPLSGPGGSGTAQNTVRQQLVSISLKQGVAAATGSQATPAADSGFTPLYVITVQNGQTTITSPNISAVAGAPFISEKLKDKISQAAGDLRYAPLSSGRTKLSANTTYYVAPTTATPAGNDTTGNGTSGAPWATIQKAATFIQTMIDLNGFMANVKLADGTYSTGLLVSGPFLGGSVAFVGNTSTPTSCVISTTGDCIAGQNGAGFSINGFQLTSTSGNGISAFSGARISTGAAMNFGAVGSSGAQMLAYDPGSIITLPTSYTISGGGLAHYNAVNGAEIKGAGISVTISGAPSFGTAFAYSASGIIQVTGSTYSGASSGSRFLSILGGVINTASGANANYFPGSTAGSNTSGYYQ